MWADRRRASVYLAPVLLLASFFATVILIPGTANAATLYVGGGGPGNYTSIQAAIDDADPRDTIYVFSGTYYENLIVNKTLTFIGEDRDTTVIDGSEMSDVVRVFSDDVSVSGFTIRNGAEGWSGAGIHFECVDGSRVFDNNFSLNEIGIFFIYSSNGTVESNEFIANGGGIYRGGVYLQLSWETLISGNNFSSGVVGLSLDGSRRITVTNNTFWNGTYGIWTTGWDNTISYNTVMDISSIGIDGHLGDYKTRNVISHNVFSRNPLAVQLRYDDNLTLSHNVISHGKVGAELWFSENAIIEGNTITDHVFFGVYLTDSPHPSVMSNYLSRNDCEAIHVSRSDHGTFVNNTLSDNGDGFTVEAYSKVIGNTLVGNGGGLSVSGSNVTVYHNNFIANRWQAWDGGTGNQWDDGYPSGGNYWSDYNGTDNKSGPDQNLPGSDGIGDTPYIVPGGTNPEDKYPLMNHFIPSPVPPTAPQNLSAAEGHFNVTLSWEPPLFEGGFPVSYYKVYRRTLGNETAIIVGNVLTYTDMGLVPGQWYHYRVSAVNAAGEGPTSGEVSAQPHGPPAKRISEKANPGDDYIRNISVEWHVSTPGTGSVGNVISYSGPWARDASP